MRGSFIDIRAALTPYRVKRFPASDCAGNHFNRKLQKISLLAVDVCNYGVRCSTNHKEDRVNKRSTGRNLAVMLICGSMHTASMAQVVSYDNETCEDDGACEGIVGETCVSAHAKVGGEPEPGGKNGIGVCPEVIDADVGCNTECTALSGGGGFLSDMHAVDLSATVCGATATVEGEIAYTAVAAGDTIAVSIHEEFVVTATASGCPVPSDAAGDSVWGSPLDDAVTIKYRFDLATCAYVSANLLINVTGDIGDFPGNPIISGNATWDLEGPAHISGSAWDNHLTTGPISDVLSTYIPAGCYTLTVVYNGMEGTVGATCAFPANERMGEADISLLMQFNGQPESEVDLVIYRGGEDVYIVPDNVEWSEGSFTIANLNDTDGDAIVDDMDSDVTSSAVGRDEVDLMRLDIALYPASTIGEVTLSSVGNSLGNVRFWESATKGSPAVTTYPASELPKTIWVECPVRSEDLRDFEIYATYSVEVGECSIVTTDQVRATAIWSDHDMFSARAEFPDFAFDPVWDHMPTLLETVLKLYGGTGVIPNPILTNNKDYGVRNGVIFKFTVTPPGVGNEPDIEFDVSRQLQNKFEFTVAAVGLVEVCEMWPAVSELANDDENANDESMDLIGMDEAYSLDYVGVIKAIINSNNNPGQFAIGDTLYQPSRFNEFLRVGLAGVRPVGNTVSGSRCSDYVPWHSILNLELFNFPVPLGAPAKYIWRRDMNKMQEIDPGHVTIPTCP
jgi:hypothetical protein